MKRLGWMFLITVLALLLAGCPTIGSGDTAAVEAAAEGWIDALNGGDAAGVAAYYAEEATIYPPHAEPISGRDAIQVFWQTLIDDGMTGELELETTSASGTLGVRIGGFKIIDSAGNIVDEGHFMEVWGLGDDGWKIVDDMWNSDWPLEPPPA